MKFVVFVFYWNPKGRGVEGMTIPITVIVGLFAPFFVEHHVFQEDRVRFVGVSLPPLGIGLLVLVRRRLLEHLLDGGIRSERL